LIDFNWRFLFILLLGTAVGVMLAIKQTRWARAIGALLWHSGRSIACLRLPKLAKKIGQLPLFTKGCIYSLLRLLPEERILFFSRWFEEACLTACRSTEKYIHRVTATSPTSSSTSQRTHRAKNLVRNV
jgi:hypothetical protein